MNISTSRLDADTLDYLEKVHRSRGDSSNGAYVQRSWTPSNPKAGWGAGVVIGLVLLGIAALLCRPNALDSADLQKMGYWQAGLALCGVFALGLGIRKLMRRNPPQRFGSFIFADGKYLWDVTPEWVSTIDLADLRNVDGTHSMYSGIYLYTRIELSVAGATRSLIVSSRGAAEDLLRFLNCLRIVRETSGGISELAATSPAMAGALAYNFAHGNSESGFNVDPAKLVNMPEPRETEASGSNKPSAMNRFGPLLAGVAAGLIGFFAFPKLNSYILDEHYYSFVPQTNNGNFGPIDRYLAKFPEGRHAGEVRDKRDDFKFDLAILDSKQNNSPASLRDYLADDTNQRHRPEAQDRINKYYDEAIAGLKKRADTDAKKLDREMFDAVLALLEALKKSKTPVVTVGFNASIDEAPVTEFQKLSEKLQYDQLLKENRDLVSVAERASDKSAILPRGEVFATDKVKLREKVIMDRLKESVQKVLGSDLLALKPSADGEKPMLEVAYHTFPATLYVYTTSNEFGRKTYNGLLRGYDIDWTITVRPPGIEKQYVCKLGSQPANSLNYDRDPKDPSWAPYAIILFSGFHDFSGRMIRNFAIEPPLAKTRFSFSDATKN